MKFILTIMIIMAFDFSSASEADSDSGVHAMKGLISMYCGDPEFLTCVDLSKTACEGAFNKSLENCSSEMSALKGLVEKETSPFDTNEKTEKAKRDAGKCAVVGLYSFVKEDLLVSCLNSSTQRQMDKLEKKYNQAQKKNADRNSAS